MSKFFINRPIVAIVISIVTVIVGIITIVACPSRNFQTLLRPKYKSRPRTWARTRKRWSNPSPRPSSSR